MKTAHHPDGSICVAGTRRVPRNFSPCCEAFNACTKNCEFDIRFEWWSKSKVWVIRIPDRGSAGSVIQFCPYCGAALQGGEKKSVKDQH